MKDPATIGEASPLLSEDIQNGDEDYTERAEQRNVYINVNTRSQTYVPVEIVIGIFMLNYNVIDIVQQFYVYDRIADDYGVKNIINTQNASVCGEISINNTDNVTSLLDKIQKESSQYYLYLIFASYFPAVLPSLFFGGLSDKISRQRTLLIAFFCSMMRLIMHFAVIKWKLPIWYLFVGNALEGIGGSLGVVTMSAYGIVADFTEPGHSRAVRFITVEVVIALSYCLALISGGLWVTFFPFEIPVSLSIGFGILDICIVFLFVPIAKPSAFAQTKSLGKLIMGWATVYNKRPFRGQLLACFACLSIFSGVFVGSSNFLNLFLLNKPLCWSQLHITVFRAAQYGGSWIVCFLCLKWLLRHFTDVSVSILGMISSILLFAMYAVAKSDWMVYLAATVGLFAFICFGTLKSIMSRLVPADEQGALFGSIGGIWMLMCAVVGVFCSFVYNATEEFFAGFTNLTMAAILVIALCLIIYVYRKQKNNRGFYSTMVVGKDIESPDVPEDIN